MKKLAIILDSFSGYTKQQLEERGINMVSQTIIVDGQPYKEGEDITVENMKSIMSGAKDIKSSMPAIGMVEDTLKELSENSENVIYITMNKGMSSTFSTGNAAASDFKNVKVLNAGTLVTSMVVEAAEDALRMAEEGKSIDEIVKTINELASSSETYIVIKDTSSIVKSGRVGTAKGMLLEKAKLFPRLQVLESGFKSAGTKRNFKKTIKSTVDKIISTIGEGNVKKYSFHIASTGDKDVDVMLKGALNLYGITDITISMVAAATLGHTGKGSYGIGAMLKK